MKYFCLLLILFPVISFAQLSGDLITDQRKIVTDIAYKISGSQTGKFVFDISVNMDGNVTSCILNKSESTLVSTPMMMKAKNLILTGLKFEKGYAFPEFHRGKVTIAFVKA